MPFYINTPRCTVVKGLGAFWEIWTFSFFFSLDGKLFPTSKFQDKKLTVSNVNCHFWAHVTLYNLNFFKSIIFTFKIVFWKNTQKNGYFGWRRQNWGKIFFFIFDDKKPKKRTRLPNSIFFNGFIQFIRWNRKFWNNKKIGKNDILAHRREIVFLFECRF